MPKITVTELARRAGVSVATVSRVFNRKELHKVGRETRARIEALMAECDYRPNANARRLASGRSRLIGFQVPSFRSPIVNSATLEAVTLRAAERGYGVLAGLAKKNGDEPSLEHMLAQGVDGLIWQPAGTASEELMKKIVVSGKKIVWFSKAVDRSWPQVGNDEVEVGRLAAKFLVERGISRFHFIGSVDSHTPPRLQGFREFLRHAGMAEPQFFSLKNYDAELPGEVFDSLAAGSGFFSCNHKVAVQIERERRRRHLDGRIVAYGDRELAEQYDSPITLIAPDAPSLGCAAFDMLETLLNNEPGCDITIAPQLVIRNPECI